MVDDAGLKQFEVAILEIKITQDKIFQALLGALDKGTIGLLEETRRLSHDVELLKEIVKSQSIQIENIVIFKRQIKTIVAGIAIIVPFVFETIKVTVGNLLNFFK